MRFDFHSNSSSSNHQKTQQSKNEQSTVHAIQQLKSNVRTPLPTTANKPLHMALRLPEIVSHIFSFLITPYQFDESNKIKVYHNIYPCLFVNTLWHDCTARLIWKSVTFEDSKSEYEAFLRYAATLSNNSNDKDLYTTTTKMSFMSTAAGLAIAVPKKNNQYYNNSNSSNAMSLLSHLQPDLPKYIEMNEDPLFIQYRNILNSNTALHQHHLQAPHYHEQQQQQVTLHSIHQNQYRNAVRSITLRKIKDKSINEPLQQLGHHTTKLEKLDIYICDHLMDSSVNSFIANNSHSLTYLSLAGCNRITDDAVLSVAKHCPKLYHLDLRACGLISDTSIQSIALHCPLLHHLNVGRVRDRERITEKSINLIAKHTQVAVLGLAGCDMTDECLILLAKSRKSGLERISVNNCLRITNKSVQAYVKYCPNLSVFEMKECHWVDDWGSVAELVQRKVLLTLCDQQNRACAEWARRRGRVMEVKAPVK